MKQFIQLEHGETRADAVQRIVDLVRDKKAKSYKPGKYALIGANDTVVKVVTITGANLTEQSYKDDVDVNRLLEPAMKKGLLRHVTKFEGEYDDFPAEDFQTAQFVVAQGKSMFEALPSRMRARFDGDPARFMEFVQDPANEGWLRAHGVLEGIDGLDAQGKPTGYDPGAPEPDPVKPGPPAPSPPEGPPQEGLG